MRSLLVVLSEYGQGLLAARAERRFAKETSAQLLELYRQERHEHPEFSDCFGTRAASARLRLRRARSLSQLLRRKGDSSFPQNRPGPDGRVCMDVIVHAPAEDDHSRTGRCLRPRNA